MGLILSSTISLIKPANFDFGITRGINYGSAADTSKMDQALPKQQHNVVDTMPNSQIEKHGYDTEIDKIGSQAGENLSIDEAELDDPVALKRTLKLGTVLAVSITLIMDFIVPIPMFLSHYVFSKGFFTFWVALGILWAFIGNFITILLPIYESREFLRKVAYGVAKDVRTGGRGRTERL